MHHTQHWSYSPKQGVLVAAYFEMSARLYQINIKTILGPMTDINVINILLIYLFGE